MVVRLRGLRVRGPPPTGELAQPGVGNSGCADCADRAGRHTQHTVVLHPGIGDVGCGQGRGQESPARRRARCVAAPASRVRAEGGEQ
eukprot:1930444-Pyramimonas_sp.AAC.1